jgi:hypothetical protein
VSGDVDRTPSAAELRREAEDAWLARHHRLATIRRSRRLSAAHLRYWAMYAMSTAVGFMLWGAMALVGGGKVHGARELIRHTARQHAIDAARKRGPYLAPVTLVASLIIMTVSGIVLIRAAS